MFEDRAFPEVCLLPRNRDFRGAPEPQRAAVGSRVIALAPCFTTELAGASATPPEET